MKLNSALWQNGYQDGSINNQLAASKHNIYYTLSVQH